MNDPRSIPGKVRIGPAKTVQVNSGFLGDAKDDGITSRRINQEGDLAGADEDPSLSVILQPSGGAAIFAVERGMSREIAKI